MSNLPDPRNDAQLLQAYREAATAVLSDPLTLDEHKPAAAAITVRDLSRNSNRPMARQAQGEH